MSKADKLLKRVEFYEKMASSTKPETSELLNKASLFERLALYSDRKSFLSAIAQGVPNVQDTESQIRNVIGSLVSSIENWIATKSERQSYLSNNLPGVPQGMAAAAQTVKAANSLGAKFDVSTLPSLLNAAKNLAYIGNLGNLNDDAKQAWLRDIFPKASQLITLIQKQQNDLANFQRDFGPEETAPEQQAIELDDVPPTKPAAPKGDGWSGPRIDPVMQTMLGTNPDGRLGRQTRAALDIYKKSRGNPAMTDAEAFALLKKEPEYRQKKGLEYDDNANVYKKSPDIVREPPF